MNILIIEDDAAIRQELKLLLENALYQVTVLTEFHHVVEDILQIEPDLLLLDVNLPQQSGFEICKSIRKTSDVPIIFLTSRTDSMDELSGNLNNFAAQFLAQLIDMYHITILGNDIHHVYCHNYRDTKFHDLCRKI